MRNIFDCISRKTFGIPAFWAVLAVSIPTITGVTYALLFPKVEASAMLQFSDTVDLPAYKRIAASYDSGPTLRAYLQAKGLHESRAGLALSQRASGDFWNQMVAPVPQFSKQDQRNFGDIKDAHSTALIGVDLRAVATSGDVARSLIELISDYVADAIIREDVRAWILARKAYIAANEPKLRAEVVRKELDIQMNERRARDMEAIIARYPDATRMDVRQVLNLSPNEGGERYLSPLAQLVGAESTISERHEKISRLNREVVQLQALIPFFSTAEDLLSKTHDTRILLDHLLRLANETFPESALREAWAEEVALELQSTLKSFSTSRNQVAIRTEVQIRPKSGRSPAQLALAGAAAGGGLLFLLALWRFNSVGFPNLSSRNE